MAMEWQAESEIRQQGCLKYSSGSQFSFTIYKIVAWIWQITRNRCIGQNKLEQNTSSGSERFSSGPQSNSRSNIFAPCSLSLNEFRLPISGLLREIPKLCQKGQNGSNKNNLAMRNVSTHSCAKLACLCGMIDSRSAFWLACVILITAYLCDLVTSVAHVWLDCDTGALK